MLEAGESGGLLRKQEPKGVDLEYFKIVILFVPFLTVGEIGFLKF